MVRREFSRVLLVFKLVHVICSLAPLNISHVGYHALVLESRGENFGGQGVHVESCKGDELVYVSQPAKFFPKLLDFNICQS